MNTKKYILLAVVLVLVVGAIWYLESLKVQPSNAGQGGGAQAINVDASTGDATDTISLAAPQTSTAESGEGTGSVNSQHPSNASISTSLLALAKADRTAGDQPAIEIADPTGFINTSSNFNLKSLIGKNVVLLDFWTYSCINCIRTLPYLTAWYGKYKDQGLVIVGIHTPEFDFEKNYTNVQAAVQKYGIHYPVVLDSNQGTWNAYNNLYWPHEYLIDLAGYIVHDHIGEGSYDETEADIQKLLAQRASILGMSPSTIATSTVSITPSNLNGINSPETYFGAARNSLLANGRFFVNGAQTLGDPSTIELNKLYLSGTWNFADQYAVNTTAGAKILYEYSATNVYLVASGAAAGATVEVMQDGKPVDASVAGSDVHDGKLVVTGSRLYNVIKNATAGEHTIELIVDSPGLNAFTFTFG